MLWDMTGRVELAELPGGTPSDMSNSQDAEVTSLPARGLSPPCCCSVERHYAVEVLVRQPALVAERAVETLTRHGTHVVKAALDRALQPGRLRLVAAQVALQAEHVLVHAVPVEAGQVLGCLRGGAGRAVRV